MNRLNLKIHAFLCLSLLVSLCPIQAAVVNANSGSYIDVSNAISRANYGDTVQIPAGTWTWTNSELAFSGITIAGAGINATVISENFPPTDGYARILNCTAVPNALSRITGITFRDGGDTYKNYKGKIEFDGRAGPTTSWRVDHCSFEYLNGDNIFVHGSAISVIDHCAFILQGTAINQYGIGLGNDSYGDASWASPSTTGTINALYIESNSFTNVIPNSSSSAVYDGYAGARSVFRNNVVWNTFWEAHGNDTSQRYRGTRQFEIYNNIFTDNQGFVTAMDFRSGTGVVFSNTVNGYNIFNTLENYRNVQPNYWGGVTGLSRWDSNDPTLYLSGTHSGTNNSPVLQVAGANWTPNQWAGYIINNTNTGRYDLIQGNTADQLIMTAPKDLAPITFNTGDGFTVYYCGAALDQVGRGSGDLIVDQFNPWPTTVTLNLATGTSTWPRQVLEPLYSWGNTLNSTPTGVTSGYANIQEGRDIYANTVKPGYTPFIYPHPLTSLTNAVSGGSSNNPAPPKTLSPPSSLAVSISKPVVASAGDTNGLLAWYRFAEGNGATTADSSGAGNTGTLIGSPTWTTGPTGNGALKFSGSGQYVIAKSGAILGGLPAWSVSCWVQLTSNNGFLPFYSESANGGNDQIILETRGDWPYYPQIFYQNDGAAFNATVAGNIAAPDGDWHFIAAAFDGSTLTLYIDGVVAGTPQAWSSNRNFTEAGIQSRIAGLNGSGLMFGGSVADVRLYSKTLSGTQISTLYTAGAQ